MRTPLALLLLAAAALADGKFIGTGPVAVDIPDQSALLVWDEGTETLVISTAFVGEGSEFAWLVPLPAKPSIEASTAGLFPTLRAMTAPEAQAPPLIELLTAFCVLGALVSIGLAVLVIRDRVRSRWVAPVLVFVCLILYLGFFGVVVLIPRGSSVGLGVAAVRAHERTVGAYETATLEAESAGEVRRWLEERGYRAPKGIDAGVQRHLDDGWCLVAARLRDEAEGRRVAHPLAFRFPSARPVYPLRLTGVGADSLSLDLFVAGTQRARCAGLEVRSCNRFGGEGGYRHQHPELVRFVPKGAVLTHLHGELDEADLAADAQVEWDAYAPHQSVIYSTAGIRRLESRAAATALLVLLISILVAVARRAGPPESSWSRVLVYVAVPPVVVYGGLLLYAALLPSAPLAGRGPDRDVWIVESIVSGLAEAGQLTPERVRAELRTYEIDEVDGPGGATLAPDDEGRLRVRFYDREGRVYEFPGPTDPRGR